ncbi:P-loop_containing nucleoside triphosphate hydrolase [Hexamita inflata]|uniref:P-loop containing nucleoside triphosphate hydrolase n=1 Tax=Hexamita inflata TaxID=28002 RepID=A0AA86PAL7_9EUKA|nr:P-loop containing nucleoside triphosphate hydrolase [Hexamita inflata]
MYQRKLLNIIILGDKQSTLYITNILQQHSSQVSNKDTFVQQQIKVELNGENYKLNFKRCSNQLQLQYSDSDVIVLCYSFADEQYQKNLIDNWFLDIYYQLEGIPIVLVGINYTQQHMNLECQYGLQKQIYAKYFVPFFKLLDNTHLLVENIILCANKKQYFGKQIELC